MIESGQPIRCELDDGTELIALAWTVVPNPHTGKPNLIYANQMNWGRLMYSSYNWKAFLPQAAIVPLIVIREDDVLAGE